MNDIEIRRRVTNRLAGLKYNIKVMRDNTIVVESDEAYESIERMKRNISGRIPGIEFIGQDQHRHMNFSKMTIRHGIPTMGKEEKQYSVKFMFKE